MYAVILAGGGGTRLWPLSSPERPKPFLPLLGDESLLQRTVARLAPLVDEADIVVVTDRHFRELARAQLPGVRILTEPTGRNTAPAVALAVAAIDRPDDEVMLVLPADHIIADEAGFRAVLAAAEAGIAREIDELEPLVTLGVEIDRPATEYGYLLPHLDRGWVVGGLQAYPLRAFEEKPNLARARELAEEPGVAWNAGIFLWRRRAIRAALERYTALLTMIGPAVGGSDAALAAAYDRLKPISIDYAVMEGAAADGRVVMGAMNVGWNDLGGWTALLEALGIAGTGRVVQPGETVEIGPDDVVVQRVDGHLTISSGGSGPGSMDVHAPIALLHGARASESLIDALIARCSQPEA